MMWVSYAGKYDLQNVDGKTNSDINDWRTEVWYTSGHI